MRSTSAFMRGEPTWAAVSRSMAEVRASLRRTQLFHHRAGRGRRKTIWRACRKPPLSGGSPKPIAIVLEIFCLIMRYQRIHQRSQLSVHHLLQLMNGQPDAVVGHAVLRKVVRPIFFAVIPA